MNQLEQYISDNLLRVSMVMDLLHRNGIVPRTIAHPSDVAEEDCDNAVEFLKAYDQST